MLSYELDYVASRLYCTSWGSTQVNYQMISFDKFEFLVYLNELCRMKEHMKKLPKNTLTQ